MSRDGDRGAGLTVRNIAQSEIFGQCPQLRVAIVPMTRPWLFMLRAILADLLQSADVVGDGSRLAVHGTVDFR